MFNLPQRCSLWRCHLNKIKTLTVLYLRNVGKYMAIQQLDHSDSSNCVQNFQRRQKCRYDKTIELGTWFQMYDSLFGCDITFKNTYKSNLIEHWIPNIESQWLGLFKRIFCNNLGVGVFCRLQPISQTVEVVGHIVFF